MRSPLATLRYARSRADGRLRELPVLLLELTARCNARCVMCDYGRDPTSRTLSWERLEAIAAQLDRWRVQHIVLSGGEPLLHERIWDFAALCGGRRRTLLTNGLLLARHADRAAAACEEVVVSLDGPGTLHDQIRGVPTFEELRRGVAALRERRPELPIRGRATVQALNVGALAATARAARQLGLSSISFLALDLTSLQAFGRSQLPPSAALAPSSEQLDALELEIETLIASSELRAFISDSPESLRRIPRLYRAHNQHQPSAAPRCNAPWVSAWLRADGTIQPCFFHPPYAAGDAATELETTLNHPQALAFRRSLRIAANPICRRCVCWLNFHG